MADVCAENETLAKRKNHAGFTNFFTFTLEIERLAYKPITFIFTQTSVTKIKPQLDSSTRYGHN